MAKRNRAHAAQRPVAAEEVLKLLSQASPDEQERFEELYLPTSKQYRAITLDLKDAEKELRESAPKSGRKPGPLSHQIWEVISYGCHLGKSYGQIAQRLNDLNLTKRDGTPHDANSVKSFANYYNIAGGAVFTQYARKYWP
jgi:hypothetical protein